MKSTLVQQSDVQLALGKRRFCIWVVPVRYRSPADDAPSLNTIASAVGRGCAQCEKRRNFVANCHPCHLFNALISVVREHALTQEVAYNSLLIERRKQLHEQAGLALEVIFASQLDDHLGQLAHHYSHSDNIDKAVEYLGRAGQQALQRSAHDEAISGLNAAIDLLQRLPDSPERLQRELPLQLALGSVLSAIKGWSAL